MAAGIALLVFAFATGGTATHGQTPTPAASPTTAVGSPTAAATTPAGTPTAVATRTVVATATATRAALTPAASPTALPPTGTGPDSGNSNSLTYWIAGAGVLMAVFGAAFAMTGVRRRR